MRKPRYMEELLKIIFLWLGPAFILLGLLCFAGLLRPQSGSMVQSPTLLGSIFSLLGIVFFIAHLIVKAIAGFKNKRRCQLLEHGTELNGTVEKVYLQKYMRYKNESPYRIVYSYTHQGKLYHHKSGLIWDKPDFAQGDPLTVYADDAGNSAVL